MSKPAVIRRFFFAFFEMPHFFQPVIAIAISFLFVYGLGYGHLEDAGDVARSAFFWFTTSALFIYSARRKWARTLVFIIGIFFALIAGAITMCSDSEDEKAAAAKQAAEAKAACAKDLQCAGDQGVISAGIVCPREIEKLAKNSMKWTDGTLEPKFSKFRWANKDQTAITFLGDRAQFQNGRGRNLL